MNIINTLEVIFRDVLDQPNLVLTETSDTKSIPDWDSMATVQIVLGVESEFDIRFTTDEVAEVKSVEAILNVLRKNGRL